MFIYITTQELTHLFILTQEELFSKIREKSEYSTLGRLIKKEKEEKRDLNRSSRDLVTGILDRANKKYIHNRT